MADDSENRVKIISETPGQLTKWINQARQRTGGPLPVGSGTVDLDSSEPVRAVEYFLASIKNDRAEATFNDYSYDLTRLLEFFHTSGITDLENLSPSDIEDFKDWRQQDGNINLTTLSGNLYNLRVFFDTCEQRGLVEEDLMEAVEMPDLDQGDDVSYLRLFADEAEAIKAHHSNIDYTVLDGMTKAWVTRGYAEFAVMWELLFRLGDCRAIDLQDYGVDEEGNKYIELVHRPDTDTPLKNEENEVERHGGERKINVPDWLATILDRYIEHHRIDVEDDYGREPLFTTRNGRVAKSTLRRDLYRITQPCRYGLDCPAGRDPDDCDSRRQSNEASKCPENVSPHPVRRGAICHQLNQGVPKDKICGRADVSRPVLEKHYNLRTKEEARKERRNVLREHLDGYGADERSAAATTATGQAIQRMNGIAAASPLVADIRSIGNRCMTVTDRADQSSPARERVVKGVAGYCAFTLLVGLNLGLMGLGFNPFTRTLIFNL